MIIFGYTPEDIKAKVIANKYKIIAFVIYSLLLLSL